MTNTDIAGEEQQEDLVNREALVTLSEAAEESTSTPVPDYWFIILIGAVAVIAMGIGIVCLILKKKRIALNSGGGKPISKKEEEAQKAVDNFLQASMKKKTSETQKKFVGEESFGGGSIRGLDTQ